MMRVCGIVGAIAALFVLPYTLSLVVVFVSAFFVPLAGLALGIMLDALYYTPEAAPFPYASITGLVATLVGIGMQRFVRTHLTSR